MAKIISARQPSGEVIVLEVTPEMTGRALTHKAQKIKKEQLWDKLTTDVKVIVGDNHLLANDAC